ncbi:flagella synthesis protein FlgN [Pollutimonas bauzanensis]|uniref:Flagella synthesis protein FlgN n=1 Tax=Pollutimonas bauzanensis TaxID=658167 RepID=A0A1M5Z580_9BURK|nr:flagellar protein FlgN [Pollutimonas bauzanensis]SHI19258.1 flagella synthesis protein FlgN [Pollutimonas bauzanensis]
MNNAVLQLQKCLDHEVDLIQGFISVLEAEAHALIEAGDTDALSASTENKNRYADQLMSVADERQGLLAQLGYSDDRAGLDAAAHDHPALLSSSEALLEKARAAAELNASNGVVIDTFLAHNQQALDALRSLAGASSLYDASGRTPRGGKGVSKNFKAG